LLNLYTRVLSRISIKKSTVIHLILLNIIIFLISVFTANLDFGSLPGCSATPWQVFTGTGVSSLQCDLGQVNYLVIHDHFYWQLVTSIFVHFGYIHIALNMIALFYFGFIIEANYGRKNLLIIFFLSGIIGNIASLFLLPLIFSDEGLYIISGGASGAIFGLIGAYAVLGKISGSFLSAILYVIIIFITSSIIPGVNIIAHLFGLISGGIIAYTRMKYH